MNQTVKNMGNLIAPRPVISKREQEPVKVHNASDRQTALFFRSTKAARKQLTILALDLECSQNLLLVEALNDLFIKHNLNPIA